MASRLFLSYSYQLGDKEYRLYLNMFFYTMGRDYPLRFWYSRQWHHLLNFATQLDMVKAKEDYLLGKAHFMENIDR